MGDVTVVRSNAPSDFLMSSRSEISNPPPTAVALATPPPSQNSFAPSAHQPAREGFSTGLIKRKRGRPRKCGLDGPPVALSPIPISSAAPQTYNVIDFSAFEKCNKVKPSTSSSFIMPEYHQFRNLGEWAPYSAGSNFTPHIITVNAGEDVVKKIISSYSERGSFAICILCANGVVSMVTLRQPDSSVGTLTHGGRFEILSLSGLFMPIDSGWNRSRTGGMAVSLASPDGRVLGGGVAGALIAATPIQVVLGTFVPET